MASFNFLIALMLFRFFPFRLNFPKAKCWRQPAKQCSPLAIPTCQPVSTILRQGHYQSSKGKNYEVNDQATRKAFHAGRLTI